MAKSYEVLGMLIPDGGYVQIGEEYEGIQFIDCEPITKEQYEAGFAQYDAWKSEQDILNATKKADLLDRLGITEEEAKLLFS
jgi:hypothetical protein